MSAGKNRKEKSGILSKKRINFSFLTKHFFLKNGKKNSKIYRFLTSFFNLILVFYYIFCLKFSKIFIKSKVFCR